MSMPSLPKPAPRAAVATAAVALAALGVAAWAVAVLPGWLAWAGCALGWTLLALAAIDFRSGILPDALTLPLIAAGLAVAWTVAPGAAAGHALGAVLGFAAFAAIGWAYKRLRGRDGLGLGDAKLLAAAGAWVSWAGLPSVVLIAAATALAAQLARALAGRPPAAAEPFAFGPYLALATWLVWLYGPLAVAA